MADSHAPNEACPPVVQAPKALRVDLAVLLVPELLFLRRLATGLHVDRPSASQEQSAVASAILCPALVRMLHGVPLWEVVLRDTRIISLGAVARNPSDVPISRMV